MATQERMTKRAEETSADETRAHAKITEHSQKLKADMDNLADDIDDILEENAEEFIQNYVQRGGE